MQFMLLSIAGLLLYTMILALVFLRCVLSFNRPRCTSDYAFTRISCRQWAKQVDFEVWGKWLSSPQNNMAKKWDKAASLC